MPTKVSEKKSKATAVADPSEAAKTRILEILKDRGRTNVFEIASEANLTEEVVLPILFTELADLAGVVQGNRDEDDDESEGHHQEVWLRLTSEEVARLAALEQDIDSSQRKCATALCEIHQSRLYREFGDFETYCERRWHHSRQWAYELMRWLEVMESLEAAGMKDYRLGIGDASELYHLRENPSEYVAAIVEAEQQAKDAGVPRTREHLRKAVVARKDYVWLLRQCPDLTLAEFDALRSLPKSNRDYVSFTSVPDCITRKMIPAASRLLEKCRGQALLDLVEQLKPVASAIAELKQLEAEQESIDKDARAERKVVHERMVALKRGLEAPAQSTAADTEATGGPAQPAVKSDGKLVVGLYDVGCVGDCFDDPGKLPKPGLIMEDVIDFLRSVDGMVGNSEVYGNWSVLVAPHMVDESEPQDDETDKSQDND